MLASSIALAGSRVYTTDEWGAAPARVSYFPKHSAIGIVIHNTEGANRAPMADPDGEREAAFANARQIQKIILRADGRIPGNITRSAKGG